MLSPVDQYFVEDREGSVGPWRDIEETAIVVDLGRSRASAVWVELDRTGGHFVERKG